MCFDLDALPPVAAISGAAVSHDDLVLEASDGNRFAASAAIADEPSGAGIVSLPDIRGPLPLLRGARPPLRGAGPYGDRGRLLRPHTGAEKRGDDFEYRPHVEQTTPEGVQADVAAAAARLREQGATAVFSVGFCFGGRHLWLAAASGHGLAGAIGFYGRPAVGRDGSLGPTQRAGELEAPILALMGGADEGIPVSDVKEFERALEGAGVEHEIAIYEGAPHSFFDRKFDEFAEASEDAWRDLLAFVEQHSGAKR